jgi:hypothetical protein
VDATLGQFDTVVMLGQNLGMLGSRGRARRLLRRLAAVTTPLGRIVAETYDPHVRDDRLARDYVERNRRRGRMPGQLRVRIRYRELATAWFDWLQVSPAELAELLEGTGWRLSRTLGDGPSYVAVIDRARSPRPPRVARGSAAGAPPRPSSPSRRRSRGTPGT